MNFYSYKQLPKITKNGFELVDIPLKTWNKIQELYELIKNSSEPESAEGIEKIIHDKDNNKISDILDINQYPDQKDIIHEEAGQILKSWVKNKYELEKTSIYGIRSYRKGAILEMHKDRVATHHISAIIIVDRKGKNWPLQIQGHDRKIYEIYAEPGQMILYESAVCFHGRPTEFEGEYFRNFYLHYKLKDFVYKAK